MKSIVALSLCLMSLRCEKDIDLEKLEVEDSELKS